MPASLQLTYAEIRREVGRLMGWNRDPAGTPPWTADQISDAADMIAGGLRQFYYPPILPGEATMHRWSFLKARTTLTTNAPYTTGTVTVVDGVVTLAGGTWPSWAAQGEIAVSGGVYAVETRDTDTQITLEDTSVDVAAGSTYELVREAYDLAADFAGTLGDLFYRPLTSPLVGRIAELHEDRISGYYRPDDYSGEPLYYALRAKASINTAEQRHEMVLWPRADRAYEITIPYTIRPTTIDSDEAYPLGGSEHGETILASVLSICELKLLDRIGEHHQKYLERLKASIEKDRLETSPDSLGITRALRLESEDYDYFDLRVRGQQEIIFD
jgi:hypothetical protein